MKIWHFHCDLSAVTFGALVIGPLVWFAMDREPPYIRESGEVFPVAPEACHLDQDAPSGLVPGGCITVKWKVRALRQCEPAPGYPVTRHLITSNGNRIPFGTAKSEYPQQAAKPGSSAPLNRVMVLPYSIPEGKTGYESEACFTCNPLQRVLPSMFAVCVNEPTLWFNIDRTPEKTGLWRR